MIESTIIALEASWELNPVLMEDEWNAVFQEKSKVEHLSNEKSTSLINSGLEDFSD